MNKSNLPEALVLTLLCVLVEEASQLIMNNAAFNGYTPSGFNRRLPTVDENRRDDARTKSAPHSLVRRANAFFYRAILKDVSSAVDGLGNASGGRASSSGIVISNLPFLHIPVKGDDFIAVRIAVVRNVQLYCVQIEDNGPLIIDMMARITKLRRSDGLRRGKMHFEQGEVVLARFSGDRKLYRASVITRVDSNEYRVFFLDYGNMEKVLVEDMYELNDEYLLTTPPQAVFVELDGVSRSELSREQFVTYFINRTVGIRLLSVTSTGEAFRVQMCVRHAGRLLDVADILIGKCQLPKDEFTQEEEKNYVSREYSDDNSAKDDHYRHDTGTGSEQFHVRRRNDNDGMGKVENRIGESREDRGDRVGRGATGRFDSWDGYRRVNLERDADAENGYNQQFGRNTNLELTMRRDDDRVEERSFGRDRSHEFSNTTIRDRDNHSYVSREQFGRDEGREGRFGEGSEGGWRDGARGRDEGREGRFGQKGESGWRDGARGRDEGREGRFGQEGESAWRDGARGRDESREGRFGEGSEGGWRNGARGRDEGREGRFGQKGESGWRDGARGRDESREGRFGEGSEGGWRNGARGRDEGREGRFGEGGESGWRDDARYDNRLRGKERGQFSDRECYNCHQMGHISRDCPERQRGRHAYSDQRESLDWNRGRAAQGNRRFDEMQSAGRIFDPGRREWIAVENGPRKAFEGSNLRTGHPPERHRSAALGFDMSSQKERRQESQAMLPWSNDYGGRTDEKHSGRDTFQQDLSKEAFSEQLDSSARATAALDDEQSTFGLRTGSSGEQREKNGSFGVPKFRSKHDSETEGDANVEVQYENAENEAVRSGESRPDSMKPDEQQSASANSTDKTIRDHICRTDGDGDRRAKFVTKDAQKFGNDRSVERDGDLWSRIKSRIDIDALTGIRKYVKVIRSDASENANPTSFYVQLSSDKELIDELSLDDMPKCSSKLNSPEPGMLCMAPYFDIFYRARILQLLDEGTKCTVLFIDYGNEEVVHTADVYSLDAASLPEMFVKKSQMAFECRLADCMPLNLEKGFSMAACRAFSELTEREVSMLVKGKCANDVYEVQLQLIDTTGTVSDALCERGLTKRVRWPSRVVPLYSEQRVLRSDNQANVQRIFTVQLRQDSEALETIAEQCAQFIERMYNKRTVDKNDETSKMADGVHRLDNRSFHVGDVLITNWQDFPYRAEVIDIVDGFESASRSPETTTQSIGEDGDHKDGVFGESVSKETDVERYRLRYVDYGNEDYKQSAEMFCVDWTEDNELFSQSPRLGIRCELFGIEPLYQQSEGGVKTEWSDEAVEVLNKYIRSDTEITVMFGHPNVDEVYPVEVLLDVRNDDSSVNCLRKDEQRISGGGTSECLQDGGVGQVHAEKIEGRADGDQSGSGGHTHDEEEIEKKTDTVELMELDDRNTQLSSEPLLGSRTHQKVTLASLLLEKGLAQRAAEPTDFPIATRNSFSWTSAEDRNMEMRILGVGLDGKTLLVRPKQFDGMYAELSKALKELSASTKVEHGAMIGVVKYRGEYKRAKVVRKEDFDVDTQKRGMDALTDRQYFLVDEGVLVNAIGECDQLETIACADVRSEFMLKTCCKLAVPLHFTAVQIDAPIERSLLEEQFLLVSSQEAVRCVSARACIRHVSEKGALWIDDVTTLDGTKSLVECLLQNGVASKSHRDDEQLEDGGKMNEHDEDLERSSVCGAQENDHSSTEHPSPSISHSKCAPSHRPYEDEVTYPLPSPDLRIRYASPTRSNKKNASRRRDSTSDESGSGSDSDSCSLTNDQVTKTEYHNEEKNEPSDDGHDKMAIVCIDGAQLNETSNSDAEILRTDPTMMLLTETTRQSETDARISAQLLPGTEDSQISTKELKLLKDSRVELEKSDEIEAENVARMEKELCSEGRGWKGVVEVKEDGGGKALTLVKGQVKEDENDSNAFTSNFVELRADVSAEVGHDESRCGVCKKDYSAGNNNDEIVRILQAVVHAVSEGSSTADEVRSGEEQQLVPLQKVEVQNEGESLRISSTGDDELVRRKEDDDASGLVRHRPAMVTSECRIRLEVSREDASIEVSREVASIEVSCAEGVYRKQVAKQSSINDHILDTERGHFCAEDVNCEIKGEVSNATNEETIEIDGN